ncbi:MAG TPA: FtsK/SpoIIIE domain-containing protein [Pilimelia sp.]|nr:FtsK/SpoIIIE domain-containing protein [Pilimelia sp.]
MPDVQRQLVATVRDALAQARGGARAYRAAAQARLDAATARLRRVRQAAAGVPERAAAVRDQRLAALAESDAALVELARRTAAAAEREAPGAASAAWDRWRPEPVAPGEPVGALRVGEVRPAPGPAVPALLPLLDHGHVVVDVADGAAGAAADVLVTTLLLRVLGRTAPGAVRLSGYDPDRLGGGLAGFAPLAGVGLLTFVGPTGLAGLLDDLVEHIRRINETVLAGEYPSLRALARRTGRRPEPWRVAVLLGSGHGDELSRHERAQLDRVVRAGPDCGVHVIARGIALPEHPEVHTILVDRGTRVGVGQAPKAPATPWAGTAQVGGYAALPVHLDPPPEPELVTATCRAIAARVAAGPTPVAFTDLLPEVFWTERADAELTAPVGLGVDGMPEPVTLGDYPPHALIGGPSGTGKTNLIYAWLGALAARYSPAEVEFYLLDFKEGVSFARFAPRRRDRSWLPHVRLVGVNVNTDREFGLALLRFLGAELRRRADAAKRHEVTKLAELRAEDPDGHWPRIVAVIDEFQVLLGGGHDALTKEAATLLEDLARRGRSQGIHLVLASQEVTGIEALWGRPALVSQFTLRIALPKARKVLPDTNPAAQTLPRYHAVVNSDSGAITANRIVRLPAASDRETWSALQTRLWRDRPRDMPEPRLFDGDAVPELTRAPDFAALSPSTVDSRGPVALLGETIDVRARSARLRLPRAPGRNLAVLGTLTEEACAVLGAAARSLQRQYAPDAVRFSVACLDPDAAEAAEALRPHLPPGTGWYGLDTVTDLLAETAAGLAGDPPDRPHYLILYAVDAATRRMAAAPGGRAAPGGPGSATGHRHLRDILHHGPEHRTHVLGWWRGVARLREDLGGPGSRTDSIGAWVALDVHGSELVPPWYSQPAGPAWYPRPWRALFFDRSVHRAAEVIIPYGLD